jgi:hypothetical protein
MKYKVYGTIELNWSRTVEADSEEEAERKAVACAEDGMVDLSDPVDDAQVTLIEPVK